MNCIKIMNLLVHYGNCVKLDSMHTLYNINPNLAL